MTRHDPLTSPFGPSGRSLTQITLRSPAELADALPYLLGFQPSDSIVMIALHGPRGRFGGRLRLGIPPAPEEWPDVAGQLAECLVTGSERRGSRPDGIILFLCQDPARGESGQAVMERLRPLAQRLRTACGALDVPVYEALCVSDGRYWSYCCPDSRCCPEEGTVLPMPGTSAMAAAAVYAGVTVRGSLRDMETRLAPLSSSPRAKEQERALDSATARLMPRMLREADSAAVREETLALARRLLARLRAAAPADEPCAADLSDDGLLSDDEAAAVVIGLQDRVTRDRAAEWMEGPDGEAALRLWRALTRRCVGPYVEHAAPPLTLAGWVAWSTGDEPSARVALTRALRADPGYLFAILLHQACDDGLDPELLRQCLRRDRADQAVRAAAEAEARRAEAADAARQAGSAGSAVGGASPDSGAAEAGETGEAGENATGERRGRARSTDRPAGPGGAPGAPGGGRRPAGRTTGRRRDGRRGARSGG
ncbi:DUF4192 domain-containing protein [Streptomyces sp. B1866]|uniref:DUF4192 domain-containing protein n=1 Tax=Streptomyces sp. B1866 TaxID=3075431 RepID=UPI00288F66C4|nr:DUF4192 domain-containing protein [Streptomyces sp. B1866]MDT3397308.1 DUF4192 domain-containing protein [Streptomyces sp. B1866]